MEADIFTLMDARRIPGPPVPLVIEPARDEIDAVACATAQRRPIRELLPRHGGILFRGFTRGSVETFRSFIAAVSREPLPYIERTSPRHRETRKLQAERKRDRSLACGHTPCQTPPMPGRIVA